MDSRTVRGVSLVRDLEHSPSSIVNLDSGCPMAPIKFRAGWVASDGNRARSVFGELSGCRSSTGRVWIVRCARRVRKEVGRWSHCQWYFQLVRCNLLRGNRFDDRLSDFDTLSPFLLRLLLAVVASRTYSLPLLQRGFLPRHVLVAPTWRTPFTFFAAATSLDIAFQCSRDGCAVAAIKGRAYATAHLMQRGQVERRYSLVRTENERPKSTHLFGRERSGGKAAE